MLKQMVALRCEGTWEELELLRCGETRCVVCRREEYSVKLGSEPHSRTGVMTPGTEDRVWQI